MRNKTVSLISLIGILSILAPDVVSAAISIGDTVRVIANLNVRTGPGTGYPEITDPDYPGYAPAGTMGEVIDGPRNANGYIWWKVDFGPRLYSGWSVQDGLEKVQAVPEPPTPLSPGSSSAPGPKIDTFTPMLRWNASSGADYYAIAIRKDPPDGPIVYNPQQVYGTSHPVPSGKLENGHEYRWNMQAHNSAGWSAVSSRLYFQTHTPDVTLTLYIHEGSASGPIIAGARVTGQDAAGNSFDKTTNFSGYVTITGTPSGNDWQFTASKNGYETVSWSQPITHTQTRHAFLQRTVPPPPTLISPVNGASGELLTPTFRWSSVSDADYYGLYISKPPYGPGNLVYENESITGTSLTLPSGRLENGVTYYWNMRSHNSAGWGSFSGSWHFTTESINQHPTCSLSADKYSGNAPLTVTFSMSANDPDGSISVWGLDVDGDGNADYTGAGNPPSTQPHTYTTPGSYIVVLGVLDNDGANAVDTVTIVVGENNPPTCALSPDKSSGKAPLTVTFSMSASDADGWITSWELLAGDGSPKYTGTGNPPSTKIHTYTTSGTYTAILGVTDNGGATTFDTETISVSPPSTKPDPPIPLSPGSSSQPGPVIGTLTPTLQWNGVSDADYYAIAIRKDPPDGPIVYNPQQVYDTSHPVPSGKLENGHEYRWNMQAHNSAGWSPVSDTLYFTGPNTSPPVQVVLGVPYIHQCWDTPEDFDGRWACSATSAVMVLAYYGTLDPWPCDCSQPYPHTSDYGNYISNIYMYDSHTFDDMSEDASGNPAYGAYGYIYHPGSIKEKMVNYFILHGLDSEIDYSPTEAEVKAEIDAGYPVVAVTWLTDEGHWIVIKGYTDDGHYIVNDPYGSKPYGAGICGNYNGADVQYTWSEMRVGERKVILAHGTVPVNNYPEGIDVSSWQGCQQKGGQDIDWSQVYGEGYRFALIRASWWDSGVDKCFVTNMENAKANGMLVGAWHFAYPEYTDAGDEARHFFDVAKDYLKQGNLMPALDIENHESENSYPYKLGPEALSNWVHEWMNTVKALARLRLGTAVEPMLYVNRDYADFLDEHLADVYDLWIAHPTCNPDGEPDTKKWSNWAFWQYYMPPPTGPCPDNSTGPNSVPGIDVPVDLDVFNGDMSRLSTFMISALLQGDINDDAKVDCTDFAILASQWLQPPGEPSADIAPEGGDGIVDFLDLAALTEHWLEGTTP